MAWTAVLTNVEYVEPVYRCTILLKKDGVDIDEEIVDVDETMEFGDAVELIRDRIRARVHAESLGSQLNDHIGDEITVS